MTAVRPEQGPALRAALAALADQDPLIDARSDEDGQVVVSLFGRVQQEVLAATLAEEYGVEAAFADASVLHVERPRRTGRAIEVLNTDSNPYAATIGLRIAPTAPGSGMSFAMEVPGPRRPAVPVPEHGRVRRGDAAPRRTHAASAASAGGPSPTAG